MVGSSDNKLKLSVVMATYNRAETIRETLRHLAEQELDPAEYEVIVVDDGSPDHTGAVVEQWRTRAPFRLTYLRHENHGPGYTQNRGLEVANAPIVLLMADDIFMSPQALRAHLDMHEAHPGEEVAALGRVEQSPALAELSVFLSKLDRMRFADFAGSQEVPYYRFWACNISVKREFVLRHGPFREECGRAGPGSHEDSELGYRLSYAGLRILYQPDALGFHHHIMTLDQMCRRAHVQGMNFVDFREQVGQPEIAVIYHVWDVTTVRDHLRVWFGPRRHYVPLSDRNPALLLGRYLLRGLAFNRLTIPLFWRPLADRAERVPALANFMRPAFYRGLIAYHFFRGYREGRTCTGAPAEQLRQA
jgi:glycosyltransferase involved in cell wall biosynthesis